VIHYVCSRRSILAAAFASLFCLLFVGEAMGKKAPNWDPIPPEDLAATDSKVSPGVSSEILFSRESLEEDEYGLEAKTYIRAKIYTAAGVEDAHLLHVETTDEMKVRSISARVVKPNGTVTELAKGDFQESTVRKDKNGDVTKHITFVFPHLAPGDIIEYRSEVTADGWVRFFSFCQEAIPVREYTFNLEANNGAVITWQNWTKVTSTGNGTDKIGVSIRDLPPFKSEPFMPPERDVRVWIRLLYKDTEESVEEYWQSKGKFDAEWLAQHSKPSSAVKKKAEELIAGAKTDDEKLQRLFDFCQTGIVHLSWSEDPQLLRERKKILDSDGERSLNEILKSGKGVGYEINYLFAALARAAKFQVYSAHNAENDEMRRVALRGGYDFLTNSTIAVKIGDQYRFFDPAMPNVPFGMNDRTTDGAIALISDEKKSSWVRVPVSGPEKSVIEHKGRFTLSSDGTLDGDVEETFTGHTAEGKKSTYWSKPAADMEKAVRDEIRERFASAEVTDVACENVQTATLPLKRRYKLHIPDYAQKAGSRLIWAINPFTAATSPLFPAATRQYPIIFNYTRTEHDDVEIVLPDGYSLDHPSAPADVRKKEDPIHATFDVQVLGKRHLVRYDRRFVLGETEFGVEDYPWIKHTFDELNRSDTHSMICRPKPAPAAAPTTPAAEPAAAPAPATKS